MKQSSDTSRSGLIFHSSPHHLSPCLSLWCCIFGAAGAGPGAVRGQPINAPGSSQTPENMQQMKKLMEQELKSDKYKTNSNKGYVFTLMPLYAIGVGVFAAYKFLKVNKDTCNTKLHLREFWKAIGVCRISESAVFRFNSQIKSADDQAQKDNFAKGAKKSVEAGVSRMHWDCYLHICVFCVHTYVWLTWVIFFLLCVCVCLHTENQLNELEQRLAQTERMLNSILTQLDPLTNWWVMITVGLHAMWSPGVSTTPCRHTLCKQWCLWNAAVSIPFSFSSIKKVMAGYLWLLLISEI